MPMDSNQHVKTPEAQCQFLLFKPGFPYYKSVLKTYLNTINTYTKKQIPSIYLTSLYVVGIYCYSMSYLCDNTSPKSRNKEYSLGHPLM